MVLVPFASLLLAHHARAVWDYVHRDFSASYAIYGAYPDAPVAPIAGDTKVAFRLTGAAAKDMFDAIGPDLAAGCPDPQIRLRNRDMLLCRHRPNDGYRCEFGFDLSTGLSIGASVGGAMCVQ
ncbi:hypothetical protein [Janthinobacterium sp. PC23-8]|uniref:hypothetical protein n=1 Tax=Janthinobacterium sp. PC23-8 TaxID=2012679 RepID=UPI00113FF4E2|nr:hypothetical protein [Janthinobacterium sp. PC23-8]